VCDLTKLIRITLLDDALPTKEKDPRSFILPCIINNLCFNKALADLGASISVMPFSTYTKLGLGELAPTKLIVELTDRTVKYLKGIAENVLVRIDKFVGAFMNVHIFVGNFSVVTDFAVVEDMDSYHDEGMGDIIVGRPFLKKHVSKQGGLME
ncbi:reverse transcriptase domain-containing protein, partial [Tanacetum coccineum]